jgi:RNA polymerase sigma-70 factor (ECF subfamily)
VADTAGRLHALLRDFGAKLRSLVELHCANLPGVDPDDIVQETRIRLWRALERDRNAVLHASYIQKVVVSTVIDARRRVLARPGDSLDIDDGAEQPAALVDRAGPEARARQDQRVALLARCLERLPQRRRAAVGLHLQGFVPAEIGGLMQVSAEAARKLVERGLEELKPLLHEVGLGEYDNE